MLDQPNEDSDRRLGKHLVSLYYDDDTQLRAQQMRAGNVDQVLESAFFLFRIYFFTELWRTNMYVCIYYTSYYNLHHNLNHKFHHNFDYFLNIFIMINITIHTIIYIIIYITVHFFFQAFLRDFISYARNNIAPEITEEAVEGLVEVRGK